MRIMVRVPGRHRTSFSVPALTALGAALATVVVLGAAAVGGYLFVMGHWFVGVTDDGDQVAVYQGLDASTISYNESSGQLTALDVFDGTVKWNVDLPAGNVSSATVANDVVFAGALDGIVRAYSTADGTLLWSYDTGVGLNAPFAVAGDLLVVPAAGLKLVGENYTPEASPVAVSDAGPAVIGFRLPA